MTAQVGPGGLLTNVALFLDVDQTQIVPASVPPPTAPVVNNNNNNNVNNNNNNNNGGGKTMKHIEGLNNCSRQHSHHMSCAYVMCDGASSPKTQELRSTLAELTLGSQALLNVCCLQVPSPS